MRHVCFTLAAPDRTTLLAELDRLLALPEPARRAVLERWSDGPIDRLDKRDADGRAARSRLAIVGSLDRADASLAIARARLPGVKAPRFIARAEGIYFSDAADPGRVAFLFPGYGSEYVGMLRELYERVPAVRAWFDELDGEASDIEGLSLTPFIYGGTAAPTDPPGSPVHDLDRGAVLGAVAALALHELLGKLGLHADLSVGHSNGEHAAIIAGGRLAGTRRDVLRWLIESGRAGAALPRPVVPERMASLTLPDRERLAALLACDPDRLFLAMDNSPHQIVAGGEAGAVERLTRLVIASGGVGMMLPFERAFHTPLFADRAAMLGGFYRRMVVQPGRAPVYSCLTSEPLPDDAAALRETMERQWTSPVRFRRTVERMYAQGARTFVEVGPGVTLAPFVTDTLRGRPHVAVSVLAKQRSDIDRVFHMAGELFASGVAIDARALAELSGVDRPVVSSLARDVHQQLAHAAREQLARARLGRARAVTPPDRWPLVGALSPAATAELRAVRTFSRQHDPFVADHALGRPASGPGDPLAVLAFTVSLEMAAQAAERLTGRVPRALTDVRATKWLALDRDRLSVEIHAVLERNHDVLVRLTDEAASVEAPAFEARARFGPDAGAALSLPPLHDARRPARWTAKDFYARYAFHGPSFQTLSDVTAIDPAGIEADVRVTAVPGLPQASCHLDPAVVDCAGQLVAFWLLEARQLEPVFAIIPVAVRRVVIARPPAAPGAVIRCRGRVAVADEFTEGSFVFETLDGEALLSVEGLVQRLMVLPAWLGAIVFGGAPVSTIPARLNEDDRRALGGYGRIWERALAHLQEQ